MQRRKTLLLACALTAVLVASTHLPAHSGKRVTKAFAGKLAHVPGHTLTAEVVDLPPGYTDEVHHHAGSVFAYILTGRIRSQNSATGPAKIYKAGETFFEPPGSDHLVTENPSATEPASLLAIHIAKDGAVLTKRGNAK